MALSIDTLTVRELCLGSRDHFEGGRLDVDAHALATQLQAADPRIARVTVHIARPGDATRIHCCKDVLQPAVKTAGEVIGRGRSLVLDNVAVVSCGPIVGFQEGIIDMSGPGARYTPFSDMLLLALEIQVQHGTAAHAHEAALRGAGLHAARYLCSACVDGSPQRSEALLWDEQPVAADLPRIAYVCMVLSQGLLHDTWVLGENAREGLPRVIDPRVILDGGIVSGNCVSACDKNTTYHHRNNPVVKALLAGHGSRWDFAGVVVTNQPVRLADKQRSARRAVELVKQLTVRGAIITKEGFGNPDSDFMMILKQLRDAGVECVGVSDEFAGSDGGSQSLADATPEADAIVSTGNANERICLPPMSHAIGPVPDVARLAGGYAGCIKDDGSLEVELQAIMGATNELGLGTLSAREV